ncbi:hypothetical protein E6C50_01920 [Flavobacterium supellecticarium]|uniref:Uncharacterized protein n=1 Tax=Flavobacterium supellecticarium TaxID=2565924 RepID=A0A4S4A3W2_9FLAO|nr:hypothetical protein [Flavobacterium supellecticarium]THF52988.1 hypothetical protein E6C50_01920 [Flavobacterium supellecticarium]
MFKRKDLGKDLSVFKKVELLMSNICALTEEEFLYEYDKSISEVLGKSQDFNSQLKSWLKLDDWHKQFDGIHPSNSTNIEISGYSNYKELLEEAHMYADIVAKRAYENKQGRLHRSSSRISILLSITAAEDFANLQCSKVLGWSKKKVSSKSLIDKWKDLIPGFETEFSEFKRHLKIRNESIIHFKNSETLDLKHIINLNHKNAKELVELVISMILKSKKSMRDGFDVVDPNNYYNHFMQYLENAVGIAKEINNRKNLNEH